MIGPYRGPWPCPTCGSHGGVLDHALQGQSFDKPYATLAPAALDVLRRILKATPHSMCHDAEAWAQAEMLCGHGSIAPAAQATQQPFQDRVQPWMMACFGPEIAADKLERNDRFIEEALELTQASGYTKDRAHALVEYVYNRPQGDINQEVGGVMVTLAAHCLAHGTDMHAAAEAELARIWTKVETIRAKQAAKPRGSALPAPALPAGPDKPVAWLRDDGLDEPVACITNRVKEIWLAAWPKQVERYTIPLGVIDAAKPADCLCVHAIKQTPGQPTVHDPRCLLYAGALPAGGEGWVSVHDRLPKLGDKVLTWDGDFVHVDEFVTHYEEPYPGGGRIPTDDWFGDDYASVTHWMPLPPPPGSERGERK